MTTTFEHLSTDNNKSILDKITELSNEIHPLSINIQNFDRTKFYDELLKWKKESYHVIDEIYEKKRIQLETILEKQKCEQEKILFHTKDLLLQFQVKHHTTHDELQQIEHKLQNLKKTLDKFINIKIKPLNINDNIIIIELNNDDKSSNLIPSRPIQEFTVSHLNEEDFKGDGLRSYAKYRDLGIAKATNGLAVAQVIRFIPPFRSEIVSKLHYHEVDFQMVYVLNGWIKSKFEGYGEFTMSKDSCWIQPPRIKHAVTAYSDDCQVLEIVLPADFKTIMIQ